MFGTPARSAESFLDIGHERFPMNILSIKLNHQGQLLVSGGRMCTG